MDRAYTEALYGTAAECVVRIGSPGGSTSLDVGSSGQTDRTLWRTAMADVATLLTAAKMTPTSTHLPYRTRSQTYFNWK